MLIDGSLSKPLEISTSPRIADQAQPPQSEETITSPAVKNNPPSRDLKRIAKSLSVWGFVKSVQRIIYAGLAGAFFLCTTLGNELINKAGSPLKTNTSSLPPTNTQTNVEGFFKDAPDYPEFLEIMKKVGISIEDFTKGRNVFLDSPNQIDHLIELFKQKDSLNKQNLDIEKGLSYLLTYKGIYIKTFGTSELTYQDLLNSKKLNQGIKSLLEAHKRSITDEQVEFIRSFIKRSIKLHGFNRYKNEDGTIQIKDITYKLILPDYSEKFVTVNIPEKSATDINEEPLVYDIANNISNLNFKDVPEINIFQKDFKDYVIIHTASLSNSELEKIGELANKEVIPVVIFSREETINNILTQIRKLEIPTSRTSTNVEFLSYDKEKNVLITQNLNGIGTFYIHTNTFREDVPVIIVPKKYINSFNRQTTLVLFSALLIGLGTRFGGNALIRRRIPSYRSVTERVQGIVLGPISKVVRKTS